MVQQTEFMHLSVTEIKQIVTKHIESQGYDEVSVQFVHSDNSENCFLGINVVAKPKILDKLRTIRHNELYYGC